MNKPQACFALLAAALTAAAVPDYIPEKPGPLFGTCEQTFEIEFSGASAADRAELTMLPLLNGKQWAVSARWDDNTVRQNNNMTDTMNARGIKGTYYFNGPEKRPDEVADLEGIRSMLAGGHSIGGHGWRHGYLGAMSGHGMMAAMTRPKIYWESVTDTPVCSYAFAFGSFASRIDDWHESARLVGATLFRAGFCQVALDRYRQVTSEKTPLCTFIQPSDGGGSVSLRAKNLAKLLADTELQAADPCIGFGIHAWTFAGKFDQADASFALVENNPDFWYCNQGEYGAYRVQFLNTEIKTERDGSTLKVTLTRPELFDLIHTVPLTFDIQGVEAGDIVAVRAGSAPVERDGTRFNLGHPDTQFAPEKTGLITNDGNRADPQAADADPDFGNLRGLLSKEGDTFRLSLVNGGEPLEDVRLTWRLPPAYNPGFVRETLEPLAGEASVERVFEPASDDHLLRFGRGFYVAQLDFRRDGKPGRLYLSCRAPDQLNDPSYPAGGFVRLGPVPADQYRPEMLEALVKGDADSVTLADGSELSFGPITVAPMTDVERQDTPLFEPDEYHPETIVLASLNRLRDSPHRAGVYIYRSTVEADGREAVRVQTDERSGVVQSVWLNGDEIYADGKAQSASLNKGKNDLLIAAATTTKAEAENIAFLFRLAEPQPGIRYHPAQ